MLIPRQIRIKLRRWCRCGPTQLLAVVVVCALFYGAIFVIGGTHSNRESDLNKARRYVENRLAEALKVDKGSGCNIPKLDPFASEVTRFDKRVPEIKCKGLDWVKCYMAECKVVPEILANTKDISCVYKDIIYENDNYYWLSPGTVVKDGGKYILTKSDHVKIKCSGKHTLSFLGSTWKGYATGFRTTVERKPVPLRREDSLNVLIFGFDSTSRNGFMRALPQSYEYLTENMKGTVLNGYNIVGDGTPAALIPILTGKTELELPDVRKSLGYKVYFDTKELIFEKLKNFGYRTAFFEDSPNIGTFQYRFNGFQHQPSDHYLRAFSMEVDSNWWKTDSKYCIGDTPQYKLMMNITDQFMQLRGKKFIFTFIVDITHDANVLFTADEDMMAFLKTLERRRVLEDTLVFIMADHGPRFANVRETLQGKLEERLPMMGILLPEKLKRRHPEVQSALEHNANSLTTPHDIYATILDVLDLEQYRNPYKVEGADLPRGMSLLKPIPRNRSCSEAGIEPHWCACVSWQKVPESEPIYRQAANAFVHYINSLTHAFRSQCLPRSLHEIKWVMHQTPNRGVLLFAGSKDEDGYFGKFHEHFEPNHENYQIKVVLAPGRADYEATLKYIIKEQKFVINSHEISRTNAYGKEPSCVSKTQPSLNPFCYCKD